MKTHLIWFCLTIIALFVGFLFGRKDPPQPQKAAKAPQSGIVAIQPASSAAQAPPARSTVVENSSPTVLPRPVETLRDLKKRKIAVVRLPIVYNNGKLSDGFVEVFDLTPTQAESLRHAIRSALEEIGRMSLENAKVVHTDNTTVITVQPFYGGADVYDRMMGAFSRTLGSEKYAAMHDLHTDELPRMFSDFGAQQRRIAITRDPTDDNRLRIQDTRRSASGSSTGRVTELTDPSQLSDFYSWLAPLLPKRK